MKKNILYFFLLVNFFINAQNTEWRLSSSSVAFKIKNAGFTVDGSIMGLKTKINFDATKSYSNTIEATIDAKTITTGNTSRDEHLKKQEYFDVTKFPLITLKATLFSKQKNGSYIGYFKLTLKNITKDVAIPFTFSEKDNKGLFKGTFTINRLDYGVGTSSIILSNNVLVTIQANVIKGNL